MKQYRDLILCVAVGSLTACGFQPVYGPNFEAQSDQVSIAEIPGRTGHALRKALTRELASGLAETSGPVVLHIDLKEKIQRVGFQPDGAASRSSVRLTARYVVELDQNALTGSQSSEVFYNVPDEVFGDIASQNDAADRAARDLARRIHDDLKIKMKSSE